MSGLGDRWNELPEALQPEHDPAQERALAELAQRRRLRRLHVLIVALCVAVIVIGARALVLLAESQPHLVTGQESPHG